MTAASDVARAAVPSTTFADIRAGLLTELVAQRAQLAEHETDLLVVEADASGAEAREIVETTIARLGAAVADIEEALGRIDAGRYGTCDMCGGAIPLERLEAIPAASTCVTCSGRRGGGLLG